MGLCLSINLNEFESLQFFLLEFLSFWQYNLLLISHILISFFLSLVKSLLQQKFPFFFFCEFQHGDLFRFISFIY